MTIAAKIIADSVSPTGEQISSVQLRYPRFIHSELMTHRVFSRNASSSRAVPVKRLIEDVERDPAMPIHWGKNEPGMQARVELEGSARAMAMGAWAGALDEAVGHARAMASFGAHKQIVNRILEPFAHINVLVTSTEWDNFFELRRHPDAQPEIHALADAIWKAKQASTPRVLRPGEWHLPYVTEEEVAAHGGLKDPTGILRKISTARAARNSYLTHDMKVPELAKDLQLYEDLVGARPLHASPSEHQATPDWKVENPYSAGDFIWANPEKHANFKGWVQHRKLIEATVFA